MTQEAEYREYILPKSAETYILSQLVNGGVLGNLLRDLKNLSTAKKITCLREGLSIDALEDYEWGNPPDGYGHTIGWLVTKIQTFLELDKERVVLLQHRLAIPSDPWIKSTGTQINSFKEEVYLSIYAEERKQTEYIRQRIKDAETEPVFIGIMSTLPKGLTVLPKELDENTLGNLASRTEHLIVGAYDGCGYIISSLDK
jgi:hypothetical protein